MFILSWHALIYVYHVLSIYVGQKLQDSEVAGLKSYLIHILGVNLLENEFQCLRLHGDWHDAGWNSCSCRFLILQFMIFFPCFATSTNAKPTGWLAWIQRTSSRNRNQWSTICQSRCSHHCGKLRQISRTTKLKKQTCIYIDLPINTCNKVRAIKCATVFSRMNDVLIWIYIRYPKSYNATNFTASLFPACWAFARICLKVATSLSAVAVSIAVEQKTPDREIAVYFLW